MTDPRYQLYYWPHIQGRGEFVRLVLEDVGIEYDDVGRASEDGFEAVAAEIGGHPRAFAPPLLETPDLAISQTANICAFLADRHGTMPQTEEGRLHANQLQLTVEDYLTEIHDTHHPISVGEHYDDQADAAERRAAFFVTERLPKFLGYFEQAVSGPFAVGDEHSYVDLSLFQILRGTRYALPNAFEKNAGDIPRLLELEERVAGRSEVSDYLDSDRRVPFDEDGIFRNYPELDR
ncbi:MAG: glutathione S-transferase [Bradymonadaceae bacterium]